MSNSFKLLCFILALTFQAGAQSGDPRKTTPALLAKLNLPSVLDPTTPSLQAGMEYRFRQKWGAEMIFGPGFYLFYPGKNRDSLYHESYKYKASVKYYGWKETYVALEFIHSNMTKNKYDGMYADEKGDRFRYHQAEVRRHYHALLIKGGGLLQVHPRIYLEISGGVGAKLLETSVTGVDGEAPTPRSALDLNIAYAVAGNQVKPHVSGELKFGYRIF